MKEKIAEIIKELTGFEEIENVDLIDNNILDSLAFIELMTELEEEFDIEIQPTQVPSDTWRSLDSIVELVENLMD